MVFAKGGSVKPGNAARLSHLTAAHTCSQVTLAPRASVICLTVIATTNYTYATTWRKSRTCRPASAHPSMKVNMEKGKQSIIIDGCNPDCPAGQRHLCRHVFTRQLIMNRGFSLNTDHNLCSCEMIPLPSPPAFSSDTDTQPARDSQQQGDRGAPAPTPLTWRRNERY